MSVKLVPGGEIDDDKTDEEKAKWHQKWGLSFKKIVKAYVRKMCLQSMASKPKHVFTDIDSLHEET